MIDDDIYDKMNYLSAENSECSYNETNRYYGKLKSIQEAFPDIIFSSFLAYAALKEENYNFVITIEDCVYNSLHEGQDVKILDEHEYEDKNTDKLFVSILGKNIHIKKSWIKDVESKIEKSWLLNEIKPSKKNIMNIYYKYIENRKYILQKLQEKLK